MKYDANKETRFPSKFANFVFIVGIFFCLLVVIYLIYKLYNPTYLPNLGNKTIENFYTIGASSFSVLGILLLFGLIKFTNSTKINLSIVFVSIFISIYMIEVFLHVTKKEYREIIAKKNQIEFDTRKILQVIDDFSDKGIKAYPNVFPTSFLSSNGLNLENKLIYPLGGISNSKIVLCNESGKWSIYDSDEYGFNNPKRSFNKNKIDIMLTGDSTTEGACVDPSENITAFLRNYGYKAASIGKSGNGPLLEFATLKEYGVPFEPKIVLWMHCFCDFDELKKERAPILKRYINEKNFSQNLIERQEEIDLVLKKYVSDEQEKERVAKRPFIKILKLYNLRKKLKLVPTVDNISDLSSDEDNKILFREIILKSKKITENWMGKFYFVYIPSYTKYTTGQNHPKKNIVIDLIKSLNIPIIDLHDVVFKMHRDPISLFPLRIDGHYTPEAYNLMAEAINDRLVNDGFLP